MTTRRLTITDRRIAETIAEMADSGGTIQAEDMVGLSRAGYVPHDPRHHTTMSLRDAWRLAGLDPEACEAALGY